MTRHQVECTDKTRLDVDEKELEILQLRRRIATSAAVIASTNL